MSDMPPLQAGAVAVARETAHSGHVQFYEDPSFLLDQLSRFVGTALGAGDAAIVIARKAIRDGVTQRLKARGFDVAQAVHQDRYIALDAADVLSKFMGNDLPDPERFSNTVETFLVRAQAAAEGRVDDEGWRIRKDGSRFWADVIITALRDESGT
jgi:hypothetical protein